MMNKRNTIQKKYIIEALMKLNHPTALDVYSYVSLKNPHISKGTIYRNLKTLVEEGQVKKLDAIDSSSRYDVNTHEHYHFICKKCGNVADVPMDYLDNVTEKIKNMNDYEFHSHTIIFKGLCPKCKNINKEE